jgi:hypothetical protein
MTRLNYKLFMLCISGACNGQTEFMRPDERVQSFKFIIETPLHACDITGECRGSMMQVAESGTIFSVIGLRDDSVIIRIWKTGNRAVDSRYCYEDSLGWIRKYFLIHEDDLAKKAVRRYEKGIRFTAGSVLIPVKLKLHNFDFAKDITLGPVAGAKMRLSHYSSNSISVVTGLGITSVTVKRTEDGAVEDVEVPALTPSLGIVFEFLNVTQAGLFFGWDLISRNDRKNTTGSGKPWLSFGLGLTILTKETEQY